ncbi:MAG: hypothetical protein LBI57_07405 [Helicobacteraceae bacterium]|nr:hypothetical protein [Helicobacteraceae bacterium]
MFASGVKAADIGFEVGAGFNTGGDHTDAVEDSYGVDSDGLGLFLELRAGVPIGLTPNAVVKPQLSLLFTFVSVEDSVGNKDDYTDTIAIPGVAAEYYINGYKNSDSVFIGAELGVVTASGGSDKYSNAGYELSGDGASFGIYGGYAFASGAKLSIGYRSIPVELEYNYGGKESYNFGGLSFLFSYALYID